MFVGIDFPSFFDADNFTTRRTTGHNMYDPESLITGAEVEKGFTYTNSKRNFRDYNHYVAAVIGDLTPEQIAEQAPRRFNFKDDDGVYRYNQTFATAVLDNEDAE